MKYGSAIAAIALLAALGATAQAHDEAKYPDWKGAWSRMASQRRPLAIHSFPLDLPDLTLVNAEALADQPAGLGHVHLVVLGVHEGQEDFFAALFRQRLANRIWCHGTSSCR